MSGHAVSSAQPNQTHVHSWRLFGPETEYPDLGWGTARQCGQLTPIDLIVEERFHRAAPGGMGGTKAAGNYSPV